MSITVQAGFLIIHLSAEFNFAREIWQGFLKELKDEIPPRYRDYLEDKGEWLIREPYHERARKVYDKFFRDKNQLSLM